MLFLKEEWNTLLQLLLEDLFLAAHTGKRTVPPFCVTISPYKGWYTYVNQKVKAIWQLRRNRNG